ncbi:hypothetical protein [Streptomyces sp. NPDC058382]|uniref:hypothetical protein n=1 Tax=unclassified Streptomyces TaxID=2593676 RepID=UPI00362BFC24
MSNNQGLSRLADFSDAEKVTLDAAVMRLERPVSPDGGRRGLRDITDAAGSDGARRHP